MTIHDDLNRPFDSDDQAKEFVRYLCQRPGPVVSPTEAREILKDVRDEEKKP